AFEISCGLCRVSFINSSLGQHSGQSNRERSGNLSRHPRSQQSKRTAAKRTAFNRMRSESGDSEGSLRNLEYPPLTTHISRLRSPRKGYKSLIESVLARTNLSREEKLERKPQSFT